MLNNSIFPFHFRSTEQVNMVANTIAVSYMRYWLTHTIPKQFTYTIVRLSIYVYQYAMWYASNIIVI